MKIFAFDIGDRWTGVATCDPEGLFARPYTTVETSDLVVFIQAEMAKQAIDTIVVGYPQTMRGTESEQTRKTVVFVDELKIQFPHISWILWDERLTSKQAQAIPKKASKNLQQQKEEKLKEHARAAAFILMVYLDRLRFQREQSMES